MPPAACPVCESPTLHKLEESSQHASINYYRCDHCGHVWTTDKKDSAQLVGHVTEPPKQRSDD